LGCGKKEASTAGYTMESAALPKKDLSRFDVPCEIAVTASARDTSFLKNNLKAQRCVKLIVLGTIIKFRSYTVMTVRTDGESFGKNVAAPQNTSN
jgi:hypothetical protein